MLSQKHRDLLAAIRPDILRSAENALPRASWFAMIAIFNTWGKAALMYSSRPGAEADCPLARDWATFDACRPIANEGWPFAGPPSWRITKAIGGPGCKYSLLRVEAGTPIEGMIMVAVWSFDGTTAKVEPFPFGPTVHPLGMTGDPQVPCRPLHDHDASEKRV